MSLPLPAYFKTFNNFTLEMYPDNAFSQSQKADALTPPICSALSTLFGVRNGELSLVKEMITVVVGLGGCSKVVCTLIQCNTIQYNTNNAYSC